jgi:hypothetical protein
MISIHKVFVFRISNFSFFSYIIDLIRLAVVLRWFGQAYAKTDRSTTDFESHSEELEQSLFHSTTIYD